MIVLGLVLLIVASISVLTTIGIILLVVGLVLALLGGAGRTIGPRRHYW